MSLLTQPSQVGAISWPANGAGEQSKIQNPKSTMAARTRRLRRSPALRAMVRETQLSADDFIYPLFVTHGQGVRNPIASMPGVDQISVDQIRHRSRYLTGTRGAVCGPFWHSGQQIRLGWKILPKMALFSRRSANSNGVPQNWSSSPMSVCVSIPIMATVASSTTPNTTTLA